MVSHFFLILVFHCFFLNHVNSSCLQHHQEYSGNCYIVVKPNHIMIMREKFDLFGDKDQRTQENQKRVIYSLDQAKKVCSSLPVIYADFTDFLKDRLEEKDELDDFALLAMVGKPKLASYTNEEQLKRLIKIGFRGCKNREGGNSFLDKKGAKSKTLPTPNMSLITNYNIDDTNGCPFIIFDPAHRELEGVIWVDEKNPYGNPQPVEKSNVICQYTVIKDCVSTERQPPCYVNEEDNQCMYHEYYDREKPPNDLGIPCPQQKASSYPRTCPSHKRRECNRTCTWGDWLVLRECVPGCGGGSHRVKIREIIKTQYPSDSYHPNCTPDHKQAFEKCDCGDGTGGNGANQGCGMLVIVAVVVVNFW